MKPAKPISVYERMLHSLCFEALLLLSELVVLSLLSDSGHLRTLALVVGLSLLAMTWNYLFNWLFDHWVGPDRSRRSLSVRILHATLFESALIVMSIPITLAVLSVGWTLAIAMSSGISVWALVFTFIYNWGFDWLRVRYYAPYAASAD